MFKTLNAMDANNMAIAKVRGRHIIAALDEEAFGRSASLRALRLNVDPTAVATTDLILVQGNKHAETWRSYFPSETGKMTVTGNPKLDLLEGDDSVQRDKYGDRPAIFFAL